MLTPGQAQEIAGLSTFALFVFLTGFGAVALWRRWLVLGWFFDEERSARLTAEAQAVRNAEALEATNATLLEYVKELRALRREIRGLRDQLRDRGAASGRPGA